MGETDQGRGAGCLHCGTPFPQTRESRKYCSPRCKTNACLSRKPSRLRASELEALHALLQEDVGSVHVLRERLREIVAPNGVRIPTTADPVFFPPDLD